MRRGMVASSVALSRRLFLPPLAGELRRPREGNVEHHAPYLPVELRDAHFKPTLLDGIGRIFGTGGMRRAAAHDPLVRLGLDRQRRLRREHPVAIFILQYKSSKFEPDRSRYEPLSFVGVSAGY